MPLPEGPAFVTGGSSGIGLALAQRCAAEGRAVALFARDPDRLQEARMALAQQAPGVPVHAEAVDVSDAPALRTAFERAAGALGGPGLLVCSAGIAVPGRFTEIPAEVHRRVMEVNFFGSLNAVHAAQPLLAPGARIGLISSAAAIVGLYGYTAYAPSKFALRGLAESLRAELEPEGIGVTLCLPPDTDTPQLADELPHRPAVTSRIAGLSAVMSADAVADALLRGMARDRFLVVPGVSLKAYYLAANGLGPAMRLLQRLLLRAESRR